MLKSKTEHRRSGRERRKGFSVTVISKGYPKMKKKNSVLLLYICCLGKNHWIILAKAVMPMTTRCGVPIKSQEAVSKEGREELNHLDLI